MEQPGQYPPQPQPQPMSPGGMPPGYGMRPPGPPWNGPPMPQVVHITARRGGLGNALMFILGLFMFAAMLGIGVVVGVLIMIGASQFEGLVLEEPYRHGGSGDKIAIIPVEGIINGERAQTVHALAEHALQDPSIKAVVLRVDSPGGGVSASDQIWYEVNRLKARNLPVVASYGGVAASGGYYVSCASDRIVAEPTCITGSIGVIAQILTLKNLLDKIGIEPVTLVASGSPDKDVANNIFRTWNESDRKKILTVLDAAYDTFHARVLDGRKSVITDPALFDLIANGSIYTAQQAKDNGLIDGVGYLDDAITDAEKLSRIPTGRADVVTLRLPPSFFGSGLFVRGPGAPAGAQSLDAEKIRGLVNELASPRLMYMMQ